MSEREQIEALGTDLDTLIERYRREFDLTYASVVGLLHIKAHALIADALDSRDEA